MSSGVTVSAPSKLILSGEHAVVYGKNAVAASLGLKTTMKLSNSSCHAYVSVSFPDIQVKQEWHVDDINQLLFCKRPVTNDHCNGLHLPLGHVDGPFLDAIADFLHLSSATSLQSASLVCFFYVYSAVCGLARPVSISVKSDIPIGAGLGSSAALSVCLAAGLLALEHGQAADRALICKLAYLSEKILHGTPSGIDNFVSTHGGFVKFVDGEFGFLDGPSLQVMLVNTQVKRNTKSLVESVRARYLSYPKVMQPILEAIDGVSRSFIAILEDLKRSSSPSNQHYEQLGQLIDYNQKLLEAMKVSHPKLDEAVQAAASLGLHAKLTGAGGGGFAYILLPPSCSNALIKTLDELLANKGLITCQTSLGVPGVHVDFT